MATVHKYGGLDLKPVAEAQMTQVQNRVTFQDVFIDFSHEEWALLDDAQKRLYCKMMLENFALVFSTGLAISRAFVATQPWAQRELQRDLWLDMSLTKALLMGVCPDLSRWCQVDSKDSKQRVLGALNACAETHPCDMCNGVMKELVHLAMKQGIPTGQQSYACKSCGSNFGFGLQNGENVFKKKMGEQEEESYTGKWHKCKKCGKIFIHTDKFIQHQKLHGKEKPYECNVCGKLFGYHSILLMHQTTHTGARPFKCDDCGRSFSRKTVLGEHQKIHRGGKPHSCNICGKSFIYKNSLIGHLKNHSAVKAYKCDLCGKSFAYLSILLTHLRTHTETRPYECGECGKTFQRKDVLSQHQKCHSVEKPYLCSTCGKGFTRKHLLIVHEKSHTEENDCKCNECGKLLAHKSHLLTHKRIHTGERPYVCNECGKAYVSKAHLTRHEKVHMKARSVEVRVENSLVAAPTSDTEDSSVE